MQAKTRKKLLLVATLLLPVAGALFFVYGRSIWVPVYQKVAGKRTVDDVLDQYGTVVRSTWKERLSQYDVAYPPGNLMLIAIKQDRSLEVWTTRDEERLRIATYPILAASGSLGPKLREGDLQVPEGLYRIEGLNPNSAFHLSMKVNYPNEFDRARGREEERSDLGGDIFIHGKKASIGCLAMGDDAIEELFVLVADVGASNTRVLISPVDFRNEVELEAHSGPHWLPALYEEISRSLRQYR